MKNLFDFLKYVIDQPNGGLALFIVVLTMVYGIIECTKLLIRRLSNEEVDDTRGDS